MENEVKLRHAGADAVVSPHRIGGHRLVSEYSHPAVTEFLDQVLTGAATLRFEEVVLGSRATCVGRKLGDMRVHEVTEAFVVALRKADGHFVYNPPDSHVIESGEVLIVLGEPECRRRLRELLGTD